MHAAAAAAADSDADSDASAADAEAGSLAGSDASAADAAVDSLAGLLVTASALVAGAGSLHVLLHDVLLSDNASTPMELNVEILLNDELTSHANGETKSSNATDFES